MPKITKGIVFEDNTWCLSNGTAAVKILRSGDIFYYNGTDLPTDKIFIKDGWTLQNYTGTRPEEGAEEYPLTNFRFVVTESQGNEKLFYIRRYSDQELHSEQLRADLDFLMFMVDLDEPVMLAASEQQTIKTSTMRTLSATQSAALNAKEEKIKRYFEMGLWTMEMVRSTYQKGIITSAAHFKAITGVNPTDQTM